MINEKIETWYALQKELARIKQAESVLREELFGELFGDHPPEGTHKHDLGDGFVLVGTQKYNRKIDVEILEKLPATLAGKCVKTSFSLNKKAYDLLDKKDKDLFDECLVITPAKPAMKIKETK